MTLEPLAAPGLRVLPKPFDLQELLAAVGRAARARQLLSAVRGGR